jgi:mono/diheme cytochrome c family protein
MERRVDDALFDAVHAGGWVLGRSARMPAFGGLLPPEDIRALVSYIRSLCACEAPAWSRDGTRRRP